MAERMKGLLPLAAAVGILAFVWTWVALNFSFHWMTDGDLGNGLDLPSNFQLMVPAAFVSWAMYFAAGGDNAAARKVAIANVFGAVGALAVMWLAPALADLPDFWGIALGVGVFGALLVLLGGLGDWYFIPATFGAFASVFFWWIATGLDNWAAGRRRRGEHRQGARPSGHRRRGRVRRRHLDALRLGVRERAGDADDRRRPRACSPRGCAALLTPKPRAAATEAPPRGSAAA